MNISKYIFTKNPYRVIVRGTIAHLLLPRFQPLSSGEFLHLAGMILAFIGVVGRYLGRSMYTRIILVDIFCLFTSGSQRSLPSTPLCLNKYIHIYNVSMIAAKMNIEIFKSDPIISLGHSKSEYSKETV